MFALHSDRIKLIALNYHQIQLWAKSWAEMEKSLGVLPTIPQIDQNYQKEIDDALQSYWLPQVAENEANYEWFTAWQVIHLKENVIIGGIGFMGLPDENGQTMVGYHTDQRFQKQGFACEALDLLLAWAFEHSSLQSVVATTNLDNIPSQRVLQKNGFNELKKDNEFVYWEKRR